MNAHVYCTSRHPAIDIVMFIAHVLCFAAMRLSPLRHALAVLRTTIGLTQKELADLVGRATRTIQAVELGNLSLSDSLGYELASKTGVSLEWLIKNKPGSPIVDEAGKPYTRASYEKARAREVPLSDSLWQYTASLKAVAVSLSMILRASLAAYRSNEVGLFAFRLTEAVADATEKLRGHEKDFAGWARLIGDAEASEIRDWDDANKKLGLALGRIWADYHALLKQQLAAKSKTSPEIQQMHAKTSVSQPPSARPSRTRH